MQQTRDRDPRVVEHDLDVAHHVERGGEVLDLGLEQDPQTPWGQAAACESCRRGGVGDAGFDSHVTLQQQRRQELRARLVEVHRRVIGKLGPAFHELMALPGGGDDPRPRTHAARHTRHGGPHRQNGARDVDRLEALDPARVADMDVYRRGARRDGIGRGVCEVLWRPRNRGVVVTAPRAVQRGL